MDKQEEAKKIVYRFEEAMDKIREAVDILENCFPEREAFTKTVYDVLDDLSDVHGFANRLYDYETKKKDSVI